MSCPLLVIGFRSFFSFCSSLPLTFLFQTQRYFRRSVCFRPPLRCPFNTSFSFYNALSSSKNFPPSAHSIFLLSRSSDCPLLKARVLPAFPVVFARTNPLPSLTSFFWVFNFRSHAALLVRRRLHFAVKLFLRPFYFPFLSLLPLPP